MINISLKNRHLNFYWEYNSYNTQLSHPIDLCQQVYNCDGILSTKYQLVILQGPQKVDLTRIFRPDVRILHQNFFVCCQI